MNFIEAIEMGTAIGFACGVGATAFVLTVYGFWCVCSWLGNKLHPQRKG